jgi:DNA-binding Xre family transcriptional regulator
MMPLRWRVKDIAEPQRWNPHSLADATGLAYNTVWGIWNNRARRADLDTLDKIARTLQVKAGELIEEVGEAERL